MDLNNYKSHVLETVTAKYAETVISEKDLDNLEWAKNYLKWYENKHSKKL